LEKGIGSQCFGKDNGQIGRWFIHQYQHQAFKNFEEPNIPCLVVMKK
jgi:hypothetical protein